MTSLEKHEVKYLMARLTVDKIIRKDIKTIPPETEIESAADMMFAPVVTRFITYSIPLPRFALPYCQAVISHPHMQEWIGGAQAEDWVIEAFEGPAEG